MIEYIRNKDGKIMTTVQHYTGKQIEENRQRFSDNKRSIKEIADKGNARTKFKTKYKKILPLKQLPIAQKGSLNCQAEILKMKAQTTALATNYRKAKKTLKKSAMCRICKTRDETVIHVSEYRK